jgi:hypothetical protein
VAHVAFGSMLSKQSKIEQSKKSHKICFQLPLLLQAAVGHVRGPVVAFLWVDVVPTSACVGRAGGVEKFRPPAKKYFFDSIGHMQTTFDVRCGDSFLESSHFGSFEHRRS